MPSDRIKLPRRRTWARYVPRPVVVYYPGDIIDGIVALYDPKYDKSLPFKVTQRSIHAGAWIWVWSPQKRPAEYYVLQARRKLYQHKVLAVLANEDLAHLARAQFESLAELASEGVLGANKADAIAIKKGATTDDVRRGARTLCIRAGMRPRG